MKITKKQLKQIINEEITDILEGIATEPAPLIQNAIRELTRGAANHGWPIGGAISQLHMALDMIGGGDFSKPQPGPSLELGLADTQSIDTVPHMRREE